MCLNIYSTNSTWSYNKQVSIPAHTNTFEKLIHRIYVPMHGMCWVSAVPYLLTCIRWLCRCLCFSVVLGILRKCMGGYSIFVLCCMCEYIVSNCMYECICVTVCLNAYELREPCRNVQILMFWMGVENTRRWCSVPEMDVWGQAPHHMHNRSSH